MSSAQRKMLCPLNTLRLPPRDAPQHPRMKLPTSIAVEPVHRRSSNGIGEGPTFNSRSIDLGRIVRPGLILTEHETLQVGSAGAAMVQPPWVSRKTGIQKYLALK